MSVTQYKKYFWLVDTIRSAGKITKEQIDRKWSGSRYNDSHEAAKWLKAIDLDSVKWLPADEEIINELKTQTYALST